MRVFVLALGTRGDFELFLSLARRLADRGHEVRLGTSALYEDRVRQLELPFVQVGQGTYDELRSVLKSLVPEHDMAERTRRYHRGWLKPQVDSGQAVVREEIARADYFINNLKLIVQQRGQAVPGAVVTYDPPPAVSELERAGTARHGDRLIDLVAMNRELIDPVRIWPDRYRFTGFWQEPAAAFAEPPPELLAFLEAGEPPIAIAMGSSGSALFDPRILLDRLTGALAELDARAIIVGGWSDVGAMEMDDERLQFVSEVAYDWLFPRCACVVHHGGVGTVATTLRAGRPAVVLPQIACQVSFGEILVERGLATGVLHLHDATPAGLAGMLGEALGNPAVADRARRWGDQLAKDRGLEGAVDLIEEHAERLAKA